MKISPSVVSTQTNLAQGSSLARAPQFVPVSYEALLFGKRPARLVDPRKYPHLKKGKRKLEALAEDISGLLGVAGGELTVSLAEGKNASISRDGELRMGVKLLEERQEDDDFLVAVVGHEVGHQPWDWPQHDLRGLTRKQLGELYKVEERKADDFMGAVLAKLGADPGSMAEFLLAAEAFEKTPPLDYDPADERVALMRRAFERQRARQVKKATIAGIAQRNTTLLR